MNLNEKRQIQAEAIRFAADIISKKPDINLGNKRWIIHIHEGGSCAPNCHNLMVKWLLDCASQIDNGANL